MSLAEWFVMEKVALAASERKQSMHMDEYMEMYDGGGFRVGRGRRDVKIQDAEVNAAVKLKRRSWGRRRVSEIGPGGRKLEGGLNAYRAHQKLEEVKP
jgi:hypothetical protein